MSDSECSRPADTTPDAELALARAVDACALTADALATRLGDDKPPFTAASPAGIRHYGAGERFELWLTWRALERLRVAWDAYRPPAAALTRKGTTQ